MSEENNSDLTYPIEEKVLHLSKFMEKVFDGWIDKNIMFTITNSEDENNTEFEIGKGNEHILASPSFLLPLFIYSSLETYEDTFKKSLPVQFYPEENSLLLWVPSIYEDKDNSLFVWTHMLDHSVEKLIKEQEPDYKKKIKKNEKIRISLDGLHTKWKENVLDIETPKLIKIKNSADVYNSRKNKVIF